jgi:Flp pilus assembly protein TadG
MRRTSGKSPHSKQLGQNMAELALLLPLLLTLVLGTLDIGRSFYTYVSLTNAAREAARYGALHNTAASSTQVQREFTSGGSDISGCARGTLTFSASGGGRGNPYTVEVSCQFTLVTPFVGAFLGALGNQLTISSTATFVVD